LGQEIDLGKKPFGTVKPAATSPAGQKNYVVLPNNKFFRNLQSDC
jgi:hypothetical protein